MPGYWGFFGGGIEEGESHEATLLREVKEELGIHPVQYVLSLTQDFYDEYDGKGIKYMYTAPFDVQDQIQLLEGQGMDWFRVAEIDDLKMIQHDKEAIVSIMKYISDD